jgi:hypothetical protein
LQWVKAMLKGGKRDFAIRVGIKRLALRHRGLSAGLNSYCPVD